MKQLLVAIVFMTHMIHGVYSETLQKWEPLLDLVRISKEEGISITMWKVYMKDTSAVSNTKEEAIRKINRCQKQFSSFDWSSLHTSTMHTATGVKHILNVTEKIKFTVYLKDGKYKTLVVYEVIGNEWDKNKWLKFLPIFTKHKGEIFRTISKNIQMYSCIQGVSSDTMKIVLTDKASSMLHNLHARKIEGMEEETFISTSAYTEKWKTFIHVGQEKMNVQLALRKHTNVETIVTIGTPIITAEY